MPNNFSLERLARDRAKELVELLLLAVERFTGKSIHFKGPIVTRTSGEQEEPQHRLEQIAEEHIIAAIREALEESRKCECGRVKSMGACSVCDNDE